MKFLALAASLLSLLPSIICSSDSNASDSPSSSTIPPPGFKPPQVFRNINLLRTINLEKSYPRVTINVVIENVDKNPQSGYYLPFDYTTAENTGAVEVIDKKDPAKGTFQIEVGEYDPGSSTLFYRVMLPEPLKPSAQQTLSISYPQLSTLKPVPAAINQMDEQFLVHEFSAYTPSAYTTLKQKTKVKFPGTKVAEYTKLPKNLNTDGVEDPQKQGTTYTYGTYGEVPAGAVEPVQVRYEFTKPLVHVSLLERDVEVSHWGGNLAIEERSWLTNQAANLSNQFSRVSWAAQQYYNPPTSALRALSMPLSVGSSDPYFVDEIGNVSTSKFRSSAREAHLELKPRYPVFGGWKYSYKVGWNNDLKTFLRKLSIGDGYVLKVPFFEGPKQQEGIAYSKVEVRVILPEGARNVRYQTSIPIIRIEELLHRTFMDTVGRKTIKLTAMNVVDDQRDKDLIVTYDYPFMAGLRKPLTIFVGIMAVFVAAWGVGQLDTSIGKRK